MKSSPHDIRPSNDSSTKNTANKKVTWGEDHVLEFISNPRRNDLIEVINSGDPIRILSVLQYMDHDKAKKYLTADRGLWMGGGLMKIAKSNSQKGIHDSQALKKVLYKFMEFDQEMISDSFASFALESIVNEESKISEQFLKDYHEVIRNFSKMRENVDSYTLANDSAPGILQQEAVENAESDDISATCNPIHSIDDTSTVNEQKVQKRASLSFVSDEEETTQHDNTQEDKASEGNTESSDPMLLLNHMLSWIYQLPEYLQTQILNSAPIKALIESAEQMANIYDVKAVEDLFAKLLNTDTAAANEAEEDISDKAKVCESSTDAIDMSMVLEEPTAYGWALPEVGFESGLFDGDHAFNAVHNFQGHGFDAF